MNNDKCDIHSYGDFKANSPELQPPNFYAPLLSFTVTRFVKDKTDPSKGILYFKETPLYYKVQKTNQVLLMEAFGPKPSDVVDKVVTFTVTKDTFKGEEVDAIRLAGAPSLTTDRPITVRYAERSRRKPRKFVLKNTSDAPFYGADSDEFRDGAQDPKQLDKAIKLIDDAEDLEAVNSVAAGFNGMTWTKDEKQQLRKALDKKRASFSDDFAAE